MTCRGATPENSRLCARVRPEPYSSIVASNQQDSAQKTWVDRLCPECGLCCDGVLFADVRLVKGDDALVLEQAGLKLKRVGGQTRFQQPCACFDGRLCRAYDQRPSRCRLFDCHTLKQARKGEVGLTEARARIRAAKRDAEQVRSLLRALGQTDEALPLTKRYQEVMNEPIDLSASEDEVERRGELMLTVSRLMDRLHRDFI